MRLVLCLLTMLFAAPALGGTFYNPLDTSLEKKGALAAATLNEALSSLHLMYAALERNDNATFQRHRDVAITQLANASGQFKNIVDQVSNRDIRLDPRSDFEKETIEIFFKYTLPSNKIAQPKTERELIRVAITLTDSVKTRLEKGDIKPGSDDWRPVRELIRKQLDLTGAGLAASLIFASKK
jgi:hypothetical protein